MGVPCITFLQNYTPFLCRVHPWNPITDIYELPESNRTPQQVVEKMLQIYDTRKEEIAGCVKPPLAKLLDLRVICAEPGEYPPDNFL